MRLLVSLFLIFNGAFCFSQHVHVYYPDGKLYTGKTHILEEINKEFDAQERVYHFSPFAGKGDDITTVGFLLFTDSALWVQTNNKSVIDSAIASFDLEKFFNSNEFKIELDAFIAKQALEESFIQEALGQPEKKRAVKTKDGYFQRWYYPTYGIDLIIENNIVTHYLPHQTQ